MDLNSAHVCHRHSAISAGTELKPAVYPTFTFPAPGPICGVSSPRFHFQAPGHTPLILYSRPLSPSPFLPSSTSE